MVEPMIYGLLRVKNEARWINRVIASIQPVCDQILVLDDHSTDGTPDICRRLSCIVFDSEFDGIHEARDKDFLLARVWEVATEGDWCLMIDGDEMLHPLDHDAVKAAVNSAMAPSYSLPIVYLWDREDQQRVDGRYSSSWRPSLFRLTHRGLKFQRTEFGGNFHCTSVPEELISCAAAIPARLLHLGYLHREDRVRKYEWYNRVDPNNEVEDRYRHMVVGDLFPADSKFRWGGPLQLAEV